MSMKSLMSAAYAAGYAMAAEELCEPPTQVVTGDRQRAAPAGQPSSSPTSDVLKAQRLLRRHLLREWFAERWPGRATA
jgi:hypothetical protein